MYTIEYRLVQIKNDFKDLLKEPDYLREKNMITIIEMLSKSISTNQEIKLKTMMKEFIAKDKDSDNDIIKYVPWLKKNMETLKD